MVLEGNENDYKVITEGYTDYSTFEKYLNKVIKQKNVK